MLTKADLQAIDKIVKKRVREEVETESENLKNELQGDITMLRLEVTRSIEELKNRIKNLEIKVTKVRKDINTVISLFDRDYINLKKKVIRMEDHLKLPLMS